VLETSIRNNEFVIKPSNLTQEKRKKENIKIKRTCEKTSFFKRGNFKLGEFITKRFAIKKIKVPKDKKISGAKEKIIIENISF
jgi:hypothetical protein